MTSIVKALTEWCPGIRARQLERLFEESGWQVLEAKYGRRLQTLFERPGGAALRRRIDEMSNEEYQALIRLPGAELRSRIIDCQGIDKAEIAAAIQDIPDETLPSVLSNLGGHDLGELLAMLAQAETEPEKPTIIFAYTIKGWGLPIAGHPLNHSMLLSETQIADLRERLGVSASDDWARFDPGSSAGQLCLEVADRLFPRDLAPPVTLSADDVPTALSLPTQGFLSTQQSLGRLLMRLTRVPKLADRIVTTSPDVSVSTNLSGWIIKTGVFTPQELPDYESEANQLRSWRHGTAGTAHRIGNFGDESLYVVGDARLIG